MKDFLPLSVPVAPEKDLSVKELKAYYRKIKPIVRKRICEFRSIIERGNELDIFCETCFCILTANANAVKCHSAIRELSSGNLLINGTSGQIMSVIKGRARFHNNKTDYIMRARDIFKKDDIISVTDKVDFNDIISARDWLVSNIKGYGYKEASHFLRNIGLGSYIAILDRHILKNLKRYGVIEDIPASVSSRKRYIEIEDKMRDFSADIKIPLEELDLVLWSVETGYVFK